MKMSFTHCSWKFCKINHFIHSCVRHNQIYYKIIYSKCLIGMSAEIVLDPDVLYPNSETMFTDDESWTKKVTWSMNMVILNNIRRENQVSIIMYVYILVLIKVLRHIVSYYFRINDLSPFYLVSLRISMSEHGGTGCNHRCELSIFI